MPFFCRFTFLRHKSQNNFFASLLFGCRYVRMKENIIAQITRWIEPPFFGCNLQRERKKRYKEINYSKCISKPDIKQREEHQCGNIRSGFSIRECNVGTNLLSGFKNFGDLCFFLSGKLLSKEQPYLNQTKRA